MISRAAGLVRSPEGDRPRTAILSKGFRPFFLLASAGAAALIFLWMLALAGAAHPGGGFGATQWHAHEMIFGYSGAVIAGFLLTAVSNWTGRETLVGLPLAGLAALWLAGRVAMFAYGALPHALVAAIDLSFLPALVVAIARPIVLANNRRNLVIVLLVGALWVCDLVIQLGYLGLIHGARRRATICGLDLVVLLIVIFAGRVFPMFTRNATRVESIRSHPRLDLLASLSMVAVTATDALVDDSRAGGVLLAVAAMLVLARSIHWGARHSLRNPMLWILHASHLFIPIGLGLRAATLLSLDVSDLAGMHALGVGAIGAATLGMMARVALGHTGRLIAAPRVIVVGFALLLGGAVTRVTGELVPVIRGASLLVAGSLWTGAFLLYVVAYARILVSPRIDGKAG